MSKRLEEIRRRWGEAILDPNDSTIHKLPADLEWLVSEAERVERLEAEVSRQTSWAKTTYGQGMEAAARIVEGMRWATVDDAAARIREMKG